MLGIEVRLAKPPGSHQQPSGAVIWPARSTQNPVPREGSEGSSPSFGTIFLAALGAFRELLDFAPVSTSRPLSALSADNHIH